MGLFGNLLNQNKQEPEQEVQEEKKLEFTPELKQLISEGKWEEIFKHKIYDSGYDTWDVLTIKEMLYEAFCATYPNLKPTAARTLGQVCDGIEGWNEVPVRAYLDSNGNFDSAKYENTCDLHAYNPMLNLFKSAKNVTFAPEHLICLNNMWADGEIDEKDFFVEISDWLVDPSLFIDGNDSEETRRLILLKKYEGGK